MKHRLVKIALISATAGAVVAVGTAALIVKHIHDRRHKKQFLSTKMRRAITEVLELTADENLPGGAVASSIYHRHINNAPDGKLLALYAAVKVGEFIHDAGIDPTRITADQLNLVRGRFLNAQTEKAGDREGLLKALLSHDLKELKPVLAVALAVLILA